MKLGANRLGTSMAAAAFGRLNSALFVPESAVGLTAGLVSGIGGEPSWDKVARVGHAAFARLGLGDLLGLRAGQRLRRLGRR